MKIFKHKKNIILSLFLSFMLFLGIGVSVPLNNAKAEILDIYDVPGANFFNIDADYTLSLQAIMISGGGDYVDVSNSFSLSYAPAENGFRITVLDDCINQVALAVGFEFSRFDSVSDPIAALTIADEYVISFDVSSSLQTFSLKSYFGLVPDNLIGLGCNESTFIGSDYLNNAIALFLGFGNSYEFPNSFAYYEEGESILISNIMITYGWKSYPYSPYYYFQPDEEDSSSDSSLNSFDSSSSYEEDFDSGFNEGYDSGFNEGFDIGYDVGFQAGEEHGYDNGYADGVKFAQYGIFWNCQCYIQLNYQYDYERISITDDFFIYGGLDLSKFLPLVENKTDVLSSFIFFNFGNSTSIRPTASSLKFFATGSESSFIENPWFVTLQNTSNSKNLRWSVVPSSTDNNPLYQTDYFDVGIAGSTVVLSFKTPTFSTFDYLRDLTIVMSDNQYMSGYTKGESDGYSNGLQAGLNDNQEEIYNEGHRVGFDSGFAKGYAENNSFLGLFTAAIDAPVITFTSLLDFEILGYNMKALVLSLLSAALVVCLIRLFSKGGVT